MTSLPIRPGRRTSISDLEDLPVADDDGRRSHDSPRRRWRLVAGTLRLPASPESPADDEAAPGRRATPGWHGGRARGEAHVPEADAVGRLGEGGVFVPWHCSELGREAARSRRRCQRQNGRSARGTIPLASIFATSASMPDGHDSQASPGNEVSEQDAASSPSRDRDRRARRHARRRGSSATRRRPSTCSKAAPAPARRRSRLQFLMAGAAAGERGLYITLSETEDELRAAAASHGWTLDGHRDLRAGPAREPARRGAAAEPALFLRPRARRDDQAHLRGVRAGQAGAGGARQPVRDPAAGAELAALPPPDPRAEALFRAPERDRAAARRPHHRGSTTRPCTASRTA